ncbi:hypothetical protein MKX01_000371 [Papaver californicum]|nr:hypothetical protein MKX01_000371 [Papaver californicum]
MTAKDIRRIYNLSLEEIVLEREEARKMRKGDGERDVLDMLLDTVADEKSDVKITRDYVKAFVLNGTLAELINHLKIFKKAREEIDSVVEVNNTLVEELDLPDLPYLQAIVKENLRLHPPETQNMEKNPLEFKPERFIANENTGENYDIKRQRFEMSGNVWFSLLKLPTELVAMIQCFDWKIVCKEPVIDMSERFGLTLPKADPLTVIPVTQFDPFVAV